jgi:hypothetical protein
MAKLTKKEAQAAVPSYVVPRECFIWLKGTKEGYEVIPGTPCAHYVAHQLELSSKAHSCDKGYLLRVSDVVNALTLIDVEEVQVNDVWARLKGDKSTSGGSEPSNHCGLVTQVVRKDGKVMNVTIQHDSSGQQKLATNDWGTYFKGGGHFYSKGGSKSPKAQLKADRVKAGLPYRDV